MKKFMTKALSVMLVLVMLMLPVSVFAEEGVTYEIKGTLELGTKTYEGSSLEYTVYTLEPSEIGTYTVSASNSVLGIVSYTMWVTTEPSAETVKDTTVVWECTAVGQSIMIAALSKAGGVNISVAKGDVEIDKHITVYYKNRVQPQEFIFEGNASSLEYVDIEDGNKDIAVLGADGFYHLNDANGPRLFMCLNDTMMSFYSMREPGQLSAIVYKADGKTPDYKVDYNGAFDEYWACVDEDTELYPVTEDLILIAKNVSDARGWFKSGGWLEGIDIDDGWMFACQYIKGESFENNNGSGKTSDDVEGIISEGGDGGIKPGEGETSGVGSDGNFTGGVEGTINNNTRLPGGSSNSNNNSGNNSNSNNNSANNTGTAHQTGDVSVAIICVLAAAAVIAVVAFVLIRKKKNTVEF